MQSQLHLNSKSRVWDMDPFHLLFERVPSSGMPRPLRGVLSSLRVFPSAQCAILPAPPCGVGDALWFTPIWVCFPASTCATITGGEVSPEQTSVPPLSSIRQTCGMKPSHSPHTWLWDRRASPTFCLLLIRGGDFFHICWILHLICWRVPCSDGWLSGVAIVCHTQC